MDLLNRFNALKRHVFYELLNIAGRVFIVVKYAEDVIIGSRGFLPQEKENGLILVFNHRMKFHWDDYGITATLVFGTSPQKCFIPTEAIVVIYSPDVGVQFTASGSEQEGSKAKTKPAEETTKDTTSKNPSSKVIKVDFENKRKL